MKVIDKKLTFLIALIGTACLVVGYLEIEHHYNYGHYFGYGLHLDVISRPQSIGIPGQTHMYEAKLFNFTIIPNAMIGCKYTSDTLQPGIAFPYLIQRWNDSTNTWETVDNEATEDFCHPVPLSRGDTKRVNYILWPAVFVAAIEPEAMGAREPFEHGDIARFVVVTSFEEGSPVETVSSSRFQIEDNVVHDDVQYRIKH